VFFSKLEAEKNLPESQLWSVQWTYQAGLP